MTGLTQSDFGDGYFVQVSLSLLRKLDGDMDAAVVLSWLHFKQAGLLRNGLLVDGEPWVTIQQEAMAGELSITRQKLGRTISRLVTAGFIQTAQLALRRVDDRTLSYLISTSTDTHQEPRPIPGNGVEALPDSGHNPRPIPGNPPIEEVKEVEVKHLVTDVTDGALPGLGVQRHLTLLSPAEELDEEFEAWWLEYPRKTNKGGARKAYVAARRRKVPSDLLLAGIRRYVAVPQIRASVLRKELTYIPHGSTWLNGERWLDEQVMTAGRQVANGNGDHWANGGEFR